MHSRSIRSFAFVLSAAIASAQIPATYVPYGSGCPGTGIGLGAGHVAPAAFTSTFGASNNVMGFSYTPTRYQQVFLASELPTAFTMAGLGLRWDNQTLLQIYGATVDLEITVGFTSKVPNGLDPVFANNFDIGTPVTVLPRSFVDYPDNLTPPPTDPHVFQVVIPWTNTFAWAPQAGRNLLIEVVQRGSTTPGFSYVLDCAWSSATSRLWGSATATSGSADGFGYGYMMQFIEQTNTAVPMLSNSDFPQLGGQFVVRLGQARPSSFGALALGFSSSQWNGVPLPANLAMVGAPACNVLTSIDETTYITTNSAGRASLQLNVPMDLGLIGLPFFQQFAVLDPTANAFGFALSNGGAGVIGT